MARLLIATGVLLAATLVQAQPPPASAQEVLSRYIAWRGGPAFEGLGSVHEKGLLTAANLQGRFEQWRLTNGSSRMDARLGPLTIQRSNTRAGGWTLNPSAQVEDLGAEAAERDRRSTALFFAPELRRAQATLLPTEQRDGHAWSVVRLTFGDADTYDLFIAADSGELLGARVTEDNATRFDRYADWRRIDGVRMPFLEEETDANPADHHLQRAQAVQLNIKAGNALFARPRSHRLWTFTGGTHATGWINFDYFHGDRLFIPALANGHPVQLLLDSGAGITVADSHFANNIALASTGSMPVNGMGGQTAMPLASGLDISIGTLSLQHVTAGILDLSGVSAMVGHPMPLILGKEAFNQLVIDIDFQRHKIAFHDPATFTAPAGAARLALGHHEDQRTIELTVEGHAPTSFDFDLGSDSALIIYSSYRDREHLLDGRRQSQALLGGVGGLNKEVVASLRSITIAGTTLSDVPADFPDAGENAANHTQTSGNVGMPVLSRFRLITDYPHDAIWVVPDGQTAAQPFRKDRSGILATPQDGRLHVLRVAPGSPAQAAGNWKEGDDITSIDGQPIGPDYQASSLSHWHEQAPGTQVTLTVSDGSTRDLTLADYY